MKRNSKAALHVYILAYKEMRGIKVKDHKAMEVIVKV